MPGRILFCSILLLRCFILNAQDLDDPEYKLGIKSGYMGFRMRDRMISTLLYTGGLAPIQIDYSHSGDNVLTNAYFIVGAGYANLRNSSLDGFKYKGDLGNFVNDTIGDLDHRTIRTAYFGGGYEVLGRLKTSANGKLKAFLGGAFTFLTMNEKFLSLDYSNSIKDSYISLNLSGQLTYDLHPKHHLAYSLSIPLINRASRNLSIEDSDPEDFSQWATFNHYFAFTSKLGYTFRFARSWSLEAVYQLNYLQCTFPRKQEAAMESLMAGINFHF